MNFQARKKELVEKIADLQEQSNQYQDAMNNINQQIVAMRGAIMLCDEVIESETSEEE